MRSTSCLPCQPGSANLLECGPTNLTRTRFHRSCRRRIAHSGNTVSDRVRSWQLRSVLEHGLQAIFPWTGVRSRSSCSSLKFNGRRINDLTTKRKQSQTQPVYAHHSRSLWKPQVQLQSLSSKPFEGWAVVRCSKNYFGLIWAVIW